MRRMKHPLPLPQARLVSANCVRVVCGCCSTFAVHFSKLCLLGLKFETKQNAQTWFWEMYRRGRVATAHHAEAVGEHQASLGKQRGCFILRISGMNKCCTFLPCTGTKLCLKTTIDLTSLTVSFTRNRVRRRLASTPTELDRAAIANVIHS